MSIDESKGKEAVAGLKDSMTRYSDEMTTIVNTTDLREALDYIAELEAKVPEEFDMVSNLKVGDSVVALVNALSVNKGERGVVKEIFQEHYPIKVDYEGRKYPVGYRRHELGKVES